MLKNAQVSSPESPAEAVSPEGRRSGTSTPDRVAAAISRGILMRRFTAGQRLIEGDLAKSLQVSRGTVREALRILAASGVVELTPHRGAVIRVLTQSDSQDLLDVMEVLAGLSARLAASKIGLPGNRARFEPVARMLRAPHTADTLESVFDERLDFYKAMFAIANNAELDRALPLARAHLFRTQYRQFHTPADLRAMIREYRSIADAILDGDERRAEAQMRKHIRNTGERMIPRLAAFSLD